LYSVGRFAIESLRLDSFWAGGYRVPQLASLVGIAISICGLLWVSQRARGATSAAHFSKEG
jgi:prolipoprotein diacylglyceryltransferase